MDLAETFWLARLPPAPLKMRLSSLGAARWEELSQQLRASVQEGGAGLRHTLELGRMAPCRGSRRQVVEDKVGGELAMATDGYIYY